MHPRRQKSRPLFSVLSTNSRTENVEEADQSQDMQRGAQCQPQTSKHERQQARTDEDRPQGDSNGLRETPPARAKAPAASIPVFCTREPLAIDAPNEFVFQLKCELPSVEQAISA